MGAGVVRMVCPRHAGAHRKLSEPLSGRQSCGSGTVLVLEVKVLNCSVQFRRLESLLRVSGNLLG